MTSANCLTCQIRFIGSQFDLGQDEVQRLSESADLFLGNDVRRQEAQNAVGRTINDKASLQTTVDNLAARKAQLHPQNYTFTANIEHERMLSLQCQEPFLEKITGLRDTL